MSNDSATLRFQRFAHSLGVKDAEMSEFFPDPKKTYVIHQVGSCYYKIGMSNNPMRRLRDLQTGNPNVLEVIATVNGDFEKPLQSLCYHQGTDCTGEWFKLNEIQAKMLVDFVLTLK